jgi:restriction endonuclease S subunit
MALFNQIDLATTVTAERLDAEHFRPDFMNAEQIITSLSSKVLGVVAKDIHRGVQPAYDKEGTIPALRTVNITTQGVNNTRQELVSEAFARKNKRGQVFPGDILVTSTGVGTLGRAVYYDDEGPAFADGHITIIRNLTDYEPLVLVTFLQSVFGQAMIERRQRGSSGQIEIYPFDFSSMPLPILPSKTEQNIKKYVLEAHSLKRVARSCYADAEAILTAALGLDHIDLSPRLFYEDTFVHAAAVGRLDAEYFSPGTQRVIEILSAGGQTIGDVAPLAKRRFKAIPGKPFDYIEIANIGEGGTAVSNTVAGEDAPSRATWIVKPGDVITSTVRPIRRLTAIILPEQDGFVCSSGFVVLRPRDIEPELLMTYLRLPLIAELLDLHTTASMYPAISTTDLLRIPFRLPDAESRTEIVAKVRESFSARAESLTLLDEAKRIVEEAITDKEPNVQQN